MSACGAIIADPATPLPPADKSYVIVQSEWYTQQISENLMGPSYEEMLAERSDEVVFNGVAFQYRDRPPPAMAGEPAATAPPIERATSAAAAPTPAASVAATSVDAPSAAAGPYKFDAARGASLYAANCVACHQATGLGLPGAFPPAMAMRPCSMPRGPGTSRRS